MIQAIIIGIAALMFFFLAVTVFLTDRHKIIAVVTLFVSILISYQLSNYILVNQDFCDIVPVYEKWTYQYGNNFTGYHWDYDASTAPPSTTNPTDQNAFLFHTWKNVTYDRVCFDYTKKTPISIYNLTSYFMRLLMLYFAGFVVYLGLDYFNLLDGLKKWLNR